MGSIKKLFSYMGPYKKDLFIAAFLVFIETTFELLIPKMMADLIDFGVSLGDLSYMKHKGLQMGLCAILALITGLAYARFAARAAYGWGARLRDAEYSHLQDFSFKNIDYFESSSLVTRMTSDVTVMQNAINGGLRPLVRSPLLLLLGIGFSFSMSPSLSLVFIILTPLLALMLFTIISHVAPMYSTLQRAVDKVNMCVEENLRAIRTVKAYVRGDHENKKFEESNFNLAQTAESTNRKAVLNLPVSQLMLYTSIVLIMFFGGRMILAGSLLVGELTGFLSYVMQVLNSMMMISNVFLLLTRSLASAERICQVLEEDPSIKEAEDPVKSIPNGSVEFKHVYFKYSENADEYTLCDINLKIESGQTIGILGATGSGKSTLVQLISRLYEPTSGFVMVANKDIREYGIKELRDSVGMVLQKNLLFSGTLRENLQWGDENASDEQIWEALKTACAYDFVNNMPMKLDARVSQAGENFSGGQKQRLCIARTLLKKPRIIIFDDSMSAVDSATESAIRKGLGEIKGLTKIFIAQRISTVKNADKIVILDEGRIADVGKHDELMERSPIYREIYSSQMKGGSENAN